jgi:hypothetical protein
LSWKIPFVRSSAPSSPPSKPCVCPLTNEDHGEARNGNAAAFNATYNGTLAMPTPPAIDKVLMLGSPPLFNRAGISCFIE